MNVVKIMPCLDMKDGRVVKGGARILLAASVFYYHILSIGLVKEYLKSRGISVNI